MVVKVELELSFVHGLCGQHDVSNQRRQHCSSARGTAKMTDEKVPLEPPPKYTDTPPAASPVAGRLRGPLPLNLPALNLIRGKRIILASASPRRRQLLAQVSC